jgi:peptide-methionine (S)-S-oxide reductase
MNDSQKLLAHKVKEETEKEKIFGKPIVTEIVPFSNFYKAEDYHQNYFAQNPLQPYCSFVIAPKLEKFNKLFKEYASERT